MRSFYLLLALILVSFSVSSQSPHVFNYQGVARDLSGQVLSNKNINLKTLILRDSESGAILFSETHNILTSDLGLFNIKIGLGNTLFGSLNTIEWGKGTYFLRIEIDPSGGNNFAFLGASQLLSVPYALYAEKTNLQGGNGISIQNNTVQNTGDLSNTNELQTLSIVDNKLNISNGNAVNLADLSGAGLWTKEDSSIYYKGLPVNIGFKNTDFNDDFRVRSPLNILNDRNGNAISFVAGKAGNKEDSTALLLKNLGDGLELINGNGSIPKNSLNFKPHEIWLRGENAYALLWKGGLVFSGGGAGGGAGGGRRTDTRFDMATETSPLRITSSKNGIELGIGNLFSNSVRIMESGDIFLKSYTGTTGIILKSPNGKCWRQTVDNQGVLESVEVTCPE